MWDRLSRIELVLVKSFARDCSSEVHNRALRVVGASGSALLVPSALIRPLPEVLNTEVVVLSYGLEKQTDFDKMLLYVMD